MTAPPIVAASADSIARAAALLRDGALVGLPTETVYGLAADAANSEAVARIYAAKDRPSFNPLIAHVDSLDAAQALGVLGAKAVLLAERFWPGPLTVVAPRRAGAGVAELACAGLDTVALRVPDHPIAQAVIAAVGGPLAAPSANRSGRLSPTRAEDVAAELGAAVALVLDAGPCRVGVESTIVAAMDDTLTLLRPGGVPREALEATAGPLASPAGLGVLAPGMLASHYAPRARLRLNADTPAEGEAFLGFGPVARPGAPNLSSSGDLVEAAANLFSALRRLDATGAAQIAVAPIPRHGLGEAINDRLRRAAAR